MKNRLLQFLALFATTAMLVSCQDEFTEEDALDAQQQIDLAIYVFDGTTVDQQAVAGATVTLIQGGESRNVTTDESGAALFTEAKVGGFIYTIEGENFTKVVEQGYLDTENFRQGQETYFVGVYPTDSENTALVKGRISIETDLTNTVTEYASGTELIAFVYLDNGTKTFAVTTDADGRYELNIPADYSGSTSVDIRFPDLELNQTLVYSKMSTDTRNFPEVLPATQEYPVLFSMYTGGASNYSNFPAFDINPVYALAEDAPADQETAVVSFIDIDNGELDYINFSVGGDYTDFAKDSVDITFTDLTGTGSGALVRISIETFTNLATAYANGHYREVLGSDYAENYLNYNSYESPSFSSSDRELRIYVYPGTTTIQNADYGTGIYREDNLD